MKQGQDLYDVTTRLLTGMRDVFKECKPDVFLIHGDTTTSSAAALAAFFRQIPEGHVEAGLRTHNIYGPCPDRMKRQITGPVSIYYFTPTSDIRVSVKPAISDGRVVASRRAFEARGCLEGKAAGIVGKAKVVVGSAINPARGDDVLIVAGVKGLGETPLCGILQQVGRTDVRDLLDSFAIGQCGQHPASPLKRLEGPWN